MGWTGIKGYIVLVQNRDVSSPCEGGNKPSCSIKVGGIS